MFTTNPSYSDITPEIMDLTELCYKNSNIEPSLYEKYDVKRGLRDLSGKGVVTGLTEISEIQSTSVDETGKSVPGKGKLYYRGIDVEDMINGSIEKVIFAMKKQHISSCLDSYQPASNWMSLRICWPTIVPCLQILSGILY